MSWCNQERRKEIDMLYAAAQNALVEARRQVSRHETADWSSVEAAFNAVVVFLKPARCTGALIGFDIPEDVKLTAILSVIYKRYALMQKERDLPPSIKIYDVSQRIKRNIADLEKEIKTYNLTKKVLYNVLQQTYDEWCEEWRNIGMKYEADELQYYMLRARMKWNLFNLAPLLLKPALRLDNIIERISAWIDGWSGGLKKARNWIGKFLDTCRSLIEWALYGIGKSLFWPFILFVFTPLITFALIYFKSGCISIEGLEGSKSIFWNNLAYSIIVFTGSDSGSLKVCASMPIHWWMAVEALCAYIFMLVVVGYLVNRLASR